MYRILSNGHSFKIQKKLLGFLWWVDITEIKIGASGSFFLNKVKYASIEEAQKYLDELKLEKKEQDRVKAIKKKKWKVIKYNSIDFISK